MISFQVRYDGLASRPGGEQQYSQACFMLRKPEINSNGVGLWLVSAFTFTLTCNYSVSNRGTWKKITQSQQFLTKQINKLEYLLFSKNIVIGSSPSKCLPPPPPGSSSRMFTVIQFVKLLWFQVCLHIVPNQGKSHRIFVSWVLETFVRVARGNQGL